MNVGDLARALESIAPLIYAEDWDNVGLLAGDRAAPLTRALLCIDCTKEVIAEAEGSGCEAIVAYHPPILRPVSRVTSGSVLFELVKRGIAVYSPHTALDAAPGGTNDALADLVGLTNRAPIRACAPKDTYYKLVAFVPPDALAKVSDAVFAAGAGRIGDYGSCSFRTPGTGTFFGEAGTKPAAGKPGTLETVGEVRLEVVVPMARTSEVVRALRGSHPYEEPAFDLVRLAPPPSEFGMGRIGKIDSEDRGSLLVRIKEAIGVPHVLLAGPRRGNVTRIAVCAGSAGGLLDAAIEQGAEVVVTGEVRHHDALRAAEAGVTVMCALHSNSERLALEPLLGKLGNLLPGLKLSTGRADRDPFTIV
jgi:dinuclear metal center YbgI/SA1388 family protein